MDQLYEVDYWEAAPSVLEFRQCKAHDFLFFGSRQSLAIRIAFFFFFLFLACKI